MRSNPVHPTRRVELRFRHEAELDLVADPIARDISAVAAVGRTLFVASDEGATVERLVVDGDGASEHEDIGLGHLVDLPAGPTGEMDVEGMDIADGMLWVVGSHSLKRDQPEPGDQDPDEALDDLTDIDRDPNRWFFGCFPVVEGERGVFDLVATDRKAGVTRTARKLKMSDDGGNQLSDAAADDPHFGPFLDVPSKENGFDVEGLAVRDDRAFLGLRGPVLRGWAIILEVRPKTKKHHRLKLRKLGEGRYRKHFVDLDGLGIRDLLFVGDDLWILAGPTMDLDGPARLYCWPDTLTAPEQDRVTPRQEVHLVAELPVGRGFDHPEALARLDDDHLLVAHDSPGEDRLTDDGLGLYADVYRLDELRPEAHGGGSP